MGKKKKMLSFKSKEAYRKWLAYGHIHGVFKKVPGHVKVKIRGKLHKVKHTRTKRKKKRK